MHSAVSSGKKPDLAGRHLLPPRLYEQAGPVMETGRRAVTI